VQAHKYIKEIRCGKKRSDPRSFSGVGIVMYYVYILQSIKDGSYYTGLTKNLKYRVNQHNYHHSAYTSTKAPYKLVWYGVFANKNKGLAFEKYLKSSSGFAFRNKHLI
jgi:predicted GIY-YIG superfamily endonuclease